MGNQEPVLGSMEKPVRMPAATTDVKVESCRGGWSVVFETPDGPSEIETGGDMVKALKIMHRCRQLLAARKK